MKMLMSEIFCANQCLVAYARGKNPLNGMLIVSIGLV
jgi:hypothetical protein